MARGWARCDTNATAKRRKPAPADPVGNFFLTLCAKRPNIHRMIANATFLRRRSQPEKGLLLHA
ncbi:hypothetical protein [Herbaspirillum sp. B65]|jgi:hypothetical protein|uniref:hypothetical protein n=1 Tax=Herbaspirillum sp. B65 TaxID=137708 RepID=UPI000A63EB20|nr:hypothetical protein [Herbaspirillum sp. B65]